MYQKPCPHQRHCKSRKLSEEKCLYFVMLQQTDFKIEGNFLGGIKNPRGFNLNSFVKQLQNALSFRKLSEMSISLNDNKPKINQRTKT